MYEPDWLLEGHPDNPPEWAVVVAYDCHLGKAGDVLSRHYGYNKARRSARKLGDVFTRIKCLDEITDFDPETGAL